jgi:putative DNA-invertase from lambdoid prophage Rac
LPVAPRVRTSEQTIEHQRTQAEKAAFKLDQVVWDEGVSGVSTKLAERPEGRRLFDLLRSGDTLVVRWVDRLGRNYQDICETIREFIRRGVVIRTVINSIIFDGATKDAMQCAVRDALIAFMAATAQAQAEATKEAQRAGIAHAKANGDARAYKGRKPSYTASVGEVARAIGLTRQTSTGSRMILQGLKPLLPPGGCSSSAPGSPLTKSPGSNLMSYHPINDPKHWLSRAKKARALAEQIDDPEGKRTMLATADDYERLAKRAEGR